MDGGTWFVPAANQPRDCLLLVWCPQILSGHEPRIESCGEDDRGPEPGTRTHQHLGPIARNMGMPDRSRTHLRRFHASDFASSRNSDGRNTSSAFSFPE